MNYTSVPSGKDGALHRHVKPPFTQSGEAVRELGRAGYVTRSRARNEKGQLTGTDYVIHEKPVTDIPTLENSTLDFPTQKKPTQENPTQLNKEIHAPAGN